MRSSRKGSNTPLVVLVTSVALLGLLGMVWLMLGEDGPGSSGPEPSTSLNRVEDGPMERFDDVVAAPETGAAESIKVPVLSQPESTPLVASSAFGPVGSVSGMVVNQLGEPVPDVRITIFQSENALIGGNFPGTRKRVDTETYSDAAGNFTLADIPRKKAYLLVGEHELYAKSESPHFRVRKNVETSGVTLTMLKGATVQGTVVEVNSGPIPGARVEMFDTLETVFKKPEDHRPWKVVFTDGAGSFAFEHVSGTSYKVRVTSEGYESQSRTVSNALEGQAKDETMAFELNRGKALEGRVVDGDGNPVEGARLEATSLTKEYQGSAVAISDANGYYLLDGMGDNYYQLRVTCAGYSDVTRPRIHITAGTILVTMYKRGQVEGWVTTVAGQPVADGELMLMRHHAQRDPSYLNQRKELDDPAGYFLFDDIEPGSYMLEARAKGWADARSEPFTITREAADQTPQLRIEMGMGGTLRGRVFDHITDPAAGASVSLNLNNHVETSIGALFGALAPSGERVREVTTDGEGRYKLDLIPPGTYQVAVTHGNSAPKAINDVVIRDDANGGNAEFDVTLPPGAVIAGKALDINQEALAFTKVQVSQKGTGFLEALTTDRDGTFRFENLRAGNYTLTLNPEKVGGKVVHPFMRLVYAQKSQKEIYVSEGQQTEGILLVLQNNEG